MRCQKCGEQEAEIHLTEIAEGEMVTSHLCSACASEKGLEATLPVETAPLADFLAQIGEGEEGGDLTGVEENCPYCGTSTNDFRQTGRLGCSECYAHFASQLRGLLRRVHGATQHMGKVYLAQATDIDDSEARLATLKRRLERAVEIEDFEAAALLRDQINELSMVEG